MMYQGTKTRKPRRLSREGQTSTYRRRKLSPLVRLAFETWIVMANVLEFLVALAALLTFVLACFIIPLLIWF